MRARRILAKRNQWRFWQTKPRKHQPAAVGNDRRLRSIVSGLLFTMDGATPTCQAVGVCSAAHGWAVSSEAGIHVMAGAGEEAGARETRAASTSRWPAF